MMPTLKNKKIMLTGATSGIGRSLLFELLKNGAYVVFCGRSAKKMEELHQALTPYNGQFASQTFNLTDETKLREFIAFALDKAGTPDILINCAGVNPAKDEVLDIKNQDIDLMMAVNFKAPLILMQKIGALMKKAKKGTIVNILSTVCLFSNEKAGAYTASKSALDAVTGVLNKEMREHNVRVISVYPGGVDTDFRPHKRDDYLTPEETAQIIIANLKTAKKAALDKLVFRPMVEKNFS
jgi:NADP-dependent 3-hydroxy acid dehydrogenase YdfG